MSINHRLRYTQVLVCLALSVLLLPSADVLSRDTEKHRVIWRDDPTTNAVIAWVQNSGSNPTVHFGTNDFGTNHSSYPNQQIPDRVSNHFSLEHNFVRLSGLQPNTVYYYVVNDSQGNSPRYWFKTAPAVPSTFNFISGGDSRNYRDARQRANRMVAKLRPMFVMFGGDMTNENSDAKWDQWLDDWELTIASDGRMTPIIPARGNHESSNNDIYNVFDSENPEIYSAHSIGGNQLRVYTLNTEINPGGNQGTWLETDLAANSSSTFKVAQYHRAIRPHTSTKSDQDDQYDAWATPFFVHGVDLVIESDVHLVKSTWPLKPSFGGGSEDGFVRNDTEGTVYTGSGTWGAPVRPDNDLKVWTRDSGSFNQFKLITVDPSGMQLRTIHYDNVDLVNSVSDSSPLATPDFLEHWSPPNGSVISFGSPGASFNLAPLAELNAGLADPLYFTVGQSVNLSGMASDDDGTISTVNYFANGSQIGTCAPSAPNFDCSWAPSAGDYEVYLEVVDNNGTKGRSGSISVTSQNQLPSVTIVSPSESSNFDFGTQIVITADASDIDGQITKVEFFADGNFIAGCQDTSAPYTCNWSPDQEGSVELKASTTDNDGGSAVSAARNVTINPPANSSPSISQTNPANGATISVGNTINFEASASDTDGSIVKVEFFLEDNLISGCSDSSEPYECSWTADQVGNYSWRAKATDDDGAETTSSDRSLTISAANQAPNISITDPADGSEFDEGNPVTLTADASDSDGSVQEVQFFQNGNFVSGCAIQNPPFTCTWTPGPGNYGIRARAEDDQGLQTLSSEISFSVVATQNQVPNVTITEPSDGSSFESGSSITIKATASDDDGTVSSVTFLANGQAISNCMISSPPYDCIFAASPGSYAIKARAQDNDGAISENSITLTINSASNQSPSATITEPRDGQSFMEGSTISIKVNSTDPDGSVEKVVFFINNVALTSCTDTSAPYECLWTPQAGSYQIKVRADDNDGAQAFSSTINLSVNTAQNQAPSVELTSPQDGSEFEEGSQVLLTATANDADGSISKVEFLVDGQQIANCIDLERPYTCSWNPSEGSYNVSARATDNDGTSSTSSASSLTIFTINQAPVLSISSPANGSTIPANSDIEIIADVQDIDGTIDKVEFFADGNFIDTCLDESYPYSCIWRPSPGSYSIQASAVDNDGALGTSSQINVTIQQIQNQAPNVEITSPLNNDAFEEGSTINVLAMADDPDGNIVSVTFMDNGTPIESCRLTSSPYECEWTTDLLGTHELTALALDNDGSQAFSDLVSVEIVAGLRAAISGDNFGGYAPYNFTMSSDGSTSPNGIQSYEWFLNGTSISTSSSFDYEILDPGMHAIGLRIVDNAGRESTTTRHVIVSKLIGQNQVVLRETNNGYFGTRDTYISRSDSDMSFGDSELLQVSKQPGHTSLISWDLRGIPSDATIDSAFVILTIQEPSINSFILYAVEKEWREYESNWNQYANGRNWEAEGATGNSDRSSNSILNFQLSSSGALKLKIPLDKLARLKSWINDSSINHGFGIYSDSGDDPMSFYSKNALDQLNRPYLEIFYTFSTGVSSEGNEKPSLVNGFELGKPYPHPWTRRSYIELVDKEDSNASLELFDMNGRLLKRLFSGRLSAHSPKRISVNADGLSGGIYLLVASNGKVRKSTTITLIK